MKRLAVLAALIGSAASAQTGAIPQALQDSGFKGAALVARGNAVIWQTPGTERQLWPWASVTKQVVATLVMQEVERGRLSLDAPASDYLPALRTGGTAPTIRQLLQHRTGLRNPNDTAAGLGGLPSFYSAEADPVGWCARERKAPGGDWSYNNCDYIVLGAVLEQVTGKRPDALIRSRLAKPLDLRSVRLLTRGANGFKLADGDPKLLAGFGMGAAIVGTPTDLLRFDRALLTDRLVARQTRDRMWAGDPKLGYMGLGQWSFTVPLKGCKAPVRIIERRGGIGSTQVRNILLPDQDMTVILFTADEAFDFGEIWQRKGLSHDLLRATACA